MKRNVILVLTVVLIAILSGCSAQGNKPITHVYAFGDDYSDNGNLKRLAPDIADWGKFFWEGRFSNGPVAVEVLADRLKVKLTDYAVGYATSGSGNYWDYGNPKLKNTGLLGQVEQYKDELKGKRADPNALYVIHAGYFVLFEFKLYVAETDHTTEFTDDIANNTQTAVSRLAESGAKRFLVINSVNLADAPATSMRAEKFQTLVNSKLASRMNDTRSQLKVEITLFDYLALSTKILENPASYGLKNVTDPCQSFANLGGTRERPPRCETPDEYYWWNEEHPTKQVHQVFGEAWAALYKK